MSGGKISRRKVLKKAAAAAGAAAAGAGFGLLSKWAKGQIAAEGSMPGPVRHTGRTGKPNIVVVLTDDQRWDHMGCAGHPFLRTPWMDRLASEGVLFSNAFVTTSLCSPSRASFLTGRYAHSHGVKNNLTPWRDESRTFFEYLKDAGYNNAFIGKWHMPGRLPRLRGVDRFVTFTVQGGQGRYFDCPLVIDGVETERPGKYITDDLTDLAIDFIRSEKDNTFCLYLAHKAVHHQFLPPPDLDGLYGAEDLRNLPPEYFSLQTMADGAFWEGALGPMEVHYRHYCECLVAVDRQLGRIMTELENLGIADDTAIVYTSDNGYSWGEHARNGKRWATEENMRVPFMVRHPRGIRGPGRRPAEMALNIDLAPTLLDIAGIAVPPQMEGRSLAPILERRPTLWRGDFLYEYFKDFPYNVPAQRAVRTGRHLYVEYEGRRRPELYDIARDPRTMTDITATREGAAALPALRRRLRELSRA